MAHNIFLSYSRTDTAIMRQLRDDLRGSGLTVWTDEGIQPGSPSWKIEIEAAIRAADCQVIIFSPDANQSKWVRAEIDFAEALKKPMFPVLARGDETDAIPFGFSTYQWIDIRNPADYASGFQLLLDAVRQRVEFTPTEATNSTTSDAAPIVPPPRPPSLQRASNRNVLIAGAGAVTIVIAVVLFVLLTQNRETDRNAVQPTMSTSQISAVPTDSGISVATESVLLSDTTPSARVLSDDCYAMIDRMQSERVDPPDMDIPEDWVQVTTDEISIALPSDWYLSDQVATSALVPIFETMVRTLENAEPLTEWWCAGQIQVGFGNLLAVRMGLVSVEEMGINFPIESMKARVHELTAQTQIEILEESIQDIPSLGTVYINHSRFPSTGLRLENTTYILSKGTKAYQFVLVFKLGEYETLKPLMDEIFSTLRILDKSSEN